MRDGTAHGDRPWIRSAVSQEWSTPRVVSRGRVHDADVLPGLVVVDMGEPVGLMTYRIEGPQLEVVTLQTFRRRKGVGRRLMEAAKAVGGKAGQAT